MRTICAARAPSSPCARTRTPARPTQPRILAQRPWIVPIPDIQGGRYSEQAETHNQPLTRQPRKKSGRRALDPFGRVGQPGRHDLADLITPTAAVTHTSTEQTDRRN
ncbi:hypothetical protein GCM10022255_088430 [Dactylosporangium darangshiense]|uniref:Uncharacterized protein n=1 Tax=Dactylosporangium darangshiense TaxID=579108 RepID=A0ABP8DNF2_9ACTN